MDIRRGAGHYFGQASNGALDSCGLGAAYLDRSALRRLLGLETKRCRGDCPQLCRTRFSFWLSADRLGRRVRGVRGNRFSHSTFSRGNLLQICRYSRMDWSQPVRDFLRYLSPIFLFARARDLLRHCCDLGYVFLRFCATEHLCRALLHAGCAIAQPGNHRIVFFLRWVRDRKMAPFYLAAIAISLSILIKITSIVIAAPILYLLVAAVYDRRGNKERRFPKPPGRSRDRPSLNFGAHRAPLQLHLALFAAITLLPSALWYWHARQIAERFYPYHFFGAGGVRLESFSWYWDIAQQTATSSLTPILAIPALIGLFVAPRGRFGCLFDWWLAAMVLFVLAVGYGNRHPWYQLPLVPITAAFAGAGCAFFESKISSRVAVAALSILLAGSFAILAFLYVRPLYESSAAQLRDAGLELNKLTASDALIVAVDGGNPTIFYYAKRKGWHFLEQNGIYDGNPKNSQQAIADLERLRRQGATHFVFTTPRFWWFESYAEFTRHLSERATLLEATPEFKIYKLSPTQK